MILELKMKRVIALTAILAGCASNPHVPANQAPATEADGHAFSCRAKFRSNSGQIAVVAKVNSDGETGEVSVSGQTQQARYAVAGFDRRWDFGLDPEGAANYAFVIEPSGDGKYFELEPSRSVSLKYLVARQYFDCKQIY